MKETRNFLNNIFKLNDLSAQIKHWKKQHTLQVMQKVFWCCATLGVRPIIANYGWQTWNILGKRWKVLNNLYTWPLILHIRSVNCVISAAWILFTINVPFLNSSPCNTDKGAFLSKKNLSVYEQISLFCDGLLALEALWPKSFIWWQSSTEMKLKMVFLYKGFFFGNILTQVT